MLQLLDRQAPDWLPWWQELILNWVGSWDTIAQVTVISADKEAYIEYLNEVEVTRQRLEQMLELDDA